MANSLGRPGPDPIGMKNSNVERNLRGAFFPLILAPFAFFAFNSCVAQEHYDDAQLNAKHYQTKAI